MYTGKDILIQQRPRDGRIQSVTQGKVDGNHNYHTLQRRKEQRHEEENDIGSKVRLSGPPSFIFAFFSRQVDKTDI